MGNKALRVLPGTPSLHKNATFRAIDLISSSYVSEEIMNLDQPFLSDLPHVWHASLWEQTQFTKRSVSEYTHKDRHSG